MLVLPTLDDVFAFERELCREEGALLGGGVQTFDGLFEQVARRAGKLCPPRIRGAQRERLVGVAVTRAKPRILARSAARPGFAAAAARLVTELQAAMLDPAAVEAAASGLEDSAYLGELAAIYRDYAEIRDSLGLSDRHTLARDAIDALGDDPDSWKARPVFLYGFDDLTREQLALVAALSRAAPVTVALTYEERRALAARATLLEQLRELGPAGEETTEPDPANTESPLLYAIERGFGNPEAEPAAPDGSLVMLRSAGERAEAETIGAEIARLLAEGEDPEGIAIAARDPARRGMLFREVLEPYGIPVALEADVPVSGTATGGALLALLRAAFTTRTAADLLAYLRGPRRGGPGDVDWLERTILRRRLGSADQAAEAWTEITGREPGELARLRSAAEDPPKLLAAVAEIARDIAEWPLAREETKGRVPGPAEAEELRAAAQIAATLEGLGRLEGLEPGPRELIDSLRGLTMPLWRGPAEGRVRIANPYRLRAGRFSHLFVASLQDGEFPRRGGGSPFLSDAQRAQLGLPERAETEAEERYLFYACLSLPRRGLWLSCRISDESGGSEQPSPLIGEVRRLLDPAPPLDPEEFDPLEATLVRSRGLDQVAFAPGSAPSEVELARSLALTPSPQRDQVLAGLDLDRALAARVRERIAAAAERERRTRAPGPLRVPAVLDELAARRQYSGTSLESFAVCSYRWFVERELSPQPLGPVPEPRRAGQPDALRPGGPLQGEAGRGPGSAARFPRRLDRAGRRPGRREGGRRRALRRHPRRAGAAPQGRSAARGLPAPRGGARPGPPHPGAARGDLRRQRGGGKPPLDLGGWELRGRIDRVDVDSAGGLGLLHDYKVSSKATPCAKFSDEGKLQLPLYLLALRDLWGIEPAGGLYQPLRATRQPRPRGMVRASADAELAGYALVSTDRLDEERFEACLEEARATASAAVGRIRAGQIDRDPRDNECPRHCGFAPICRRERGIVPQLLDEEEQPELAA